MEKQIDVVGKTEAGAGGARLPYVAPELVVMGMIADATLSNGNNSGSDAVYS